MWVLWLVYEKGHLCLNGDHLILHSRQAALGQHVRGTNKQDSHQTCFRFAKVAIINRCYLLVTLHIILLGVGGTIYNTHTLKPFKELGLDAQRVKKLASKLHVHSVNFAAKLDHTRRALSSTVINCHQEPVPGQACNPLDPH